MQPQLVLYIASVAGAVSLFLLMPKPGRDLRILGGLLGAATLGACWLVLAPLTLADPQKGLPFLETGFSDGQTPFYYVFSAIAIAAAVRVITHNRPVYSALWFVMVVVSSAGLLLTLSAEFMAFAMLIIYGGAILVTYMFVIMLATPPRGADDSDDGPRYDRYAMEPIWASAAGFLLLAVILSVAFEPMQPNASARAEPDAVVAENILAGDADAADVSALATPSGQPRQIDAAGNPVPELSNVQRVGLDLFQAHPLAIELAGIILLLALIGAVVIAKTQIHEEDEASAPENAPPAQGAAP
ncbi:MAG: NADH-quinone oxidoreductase subunit J [Planctomycetota bacterium]